MIRQLAGESLRFLWVRRELLDRPSRDSAGELVDEPSDCIVELGRKLPQGSNAGTLLSGRSGFLRWLLLMWCQVGAVILGSTMVQAVRERAVMAGGERFPADAGVLDVTQYGVIPDDEMDDTAAIQSLLNAHPSGHTIFYFPKGVYEISSTLRPAIDDGVTKRNIFQGESEKGTVLKLCDNMGFRDAVIDFGRGPAQFFRNAVRDLTIDIGIGNPQASGLKFNASNQGTVRNVTIRSGEGGKIGLDLQHSDEIGPLLVDHLTVEGFDRGIVTRFQTASQTFENITLNNQGSVGWHNLSSQTVFARGVFCRGEVTAILNNGEGRMLLVDAQLQGRGDAINQTAVRNQKSLYLRNVRISGFGGGLGSRLVSSRGNGGLATGLIEEYWANGSANQRRGGPFELFPSPDTMLRLPIRDIPRLDPDPLSDWAGPHQFGGAPNDGIDDTAAIQAALNSGAKTVYLPRGTWQLQGTVKVEGAVHRVLGTEASLQGGGTIRIGRGRPQTVIIERLQGGSIRYEHASQRTLVLQHLLGFQYHSSVPKPGDLFLSDVTGKHLVLHNQNVWARQLDLESDIEEDPEIPAKILNDGARLVILGLKTEDDGTHIKTIHAGQTELLGALHVGGFGSQPRFVTIDSALSAAIVKGGGGTVQETRSGVTRSGNMGNADVYTAFSAGWLLPEEIILDNRTTTGVTVVGLWGRSSAFPGGFLESDFLYSTDKAASVTYTPQIPVAGVWEVFVRWVDDRSGQNHSNHASSASVDVFYHGGMSTAVVDQRRGGGRWVSVGRFPFAKGQGNSVVIRVKGAQGKVIADGVRWRRVSPNSDR